MQHAEFLILFTFSFFAGALPGLLIMRRTKRFHNQIKAPISFPSLVPIVSLLLPYSLSMFLLVVISRQTDLTMLPVDSFLKLGIILLSLDLVTFYFGIFFGVHSYLGRLDDAFPEILSKTAFPRLKGYFLVLVGDLVLLALLWIFYEQLSIWP